MKTKLNGILTLFLALVVQVAFAQQTITGKVVDVSNEAIFGATVQVKGTNIGVTTDFDGNYSISARPEQTLVFSSSGYGAKEVAVGAQRIINVTLVASLDAVVIDTYRTTPPKQSTIASTTITFEELEDRPNVSFIQRLQGQVSGLNVQTGSGQPGANSLIELRGPGSINGNTEPLIIVDGVPIDEDNFRAINPNEYETVTVLKDAAGTAIYGNRGANGVIVITTRKGKFNSPLKISYQSLTGFTSLIDNDYNLYDAQGLLRLENREETGLGGTLTPGEIDAFTTNTKWSDIFFRNAVTNSHNINFSQGGDKTTIFTSLNYTSQEGALVKSGLERFNLRSNVTGKNDKGNFRYGTNLSLGYSKSDTPAAIGSGALFGNYVLGAFNALPYLNPADYNNDALSVPESETFQNSPFYLLDGLQYVGNERNDLKIITAGNVEYDITKKLTLKYTVGADYTNVRGLNFRDPRGALERSDVVQGLAGGSQGESLFEDFRFNSNLGLNYRTKLDKEGNHNLTSSVFLEYVKSHFKSFNYNQNGIDTRTFAAGNGSGYILDSAANDLFVPTVGSGKGSYGIFSYFGLVDYDFKSKYGFSATLRRDASSRFTDDNKWGTFFSVAGRWNIDQEEFMQGSKFDLLKLRASYGAVGNDRISDTYYGSLTLTRALFGTGNGYADNQTFLQTQFANTSLRWETITTLNFGIDYGIWNNRLRGSLEFYNKATTDLFFNERLSASTGNGYAIAANSGDLVNRGIELNSLYNAVVAKKQGDFSLELVANIAYNQNEVTFVNIDGGLQDNGSIVIGEGRSINEYFTIPYLGVNPANGNLLFLGIDGEVTENPTNADRRFSGRDNIPDFQGGFGFNTSYKNFFLNLNFNFITGIDVLDFDYSSFTNPAFIGLLNLSSDLDRAWITPGQITDVPRLDAPNAAIPNTDRFLKKADFMRLRFAQFGYDFPKTMLDKTFLNNARIFVSGENLLTFSKFRGSDPERPDLATQFDYPNSRIVTFGFEVNF